MGPSSHIPFASPEVDRTSGRRVVAPWDGKIVAHRCESNDLAELLQILRWGSNNVDLLIVARALACPSRLFLLQCLGEQGLPLVEAARRAELAPSTAHHHLRVLIAAGLATRMGHGRRARYAWSPTRCALAVTRG